MSGVPDAMEAEFDTVARWTEEVVRDLGAEYAIPAACRGSGSPASLAWLVDALQLEPGTRFLDAGAGMGGPAAWLRERHGLTPVLVEPMVRAATAARRLFALPSVAAWCEDLPFASRSFDAAWALAVLSTTPHKAELLSELRRVMVPGGRIGLLVYAARTRPLPLAVPDGTSFPTEDEVTALLDASGFRLVSTADARPLMTAPETWRARNERLQERLETEHGSDPRWLSTELQQRHMDALLAGGNVAPLLMHAAAV